MHSQLLTLENTQPLYKHLQPTLHLFLSMGSKCWVGFKMHLSFELSACLVLIVTSLINLHTASHISKFTSRRSPASGKVTHLQTVDNLLKGIQSSPTKTHSKSKTPVTSRAVIWPSSSFNDSKMRCHCWCANSLVAVLSRVEELGIQTGLRFCLGTPGDNGRET